MLSRYPHTIPPQSSFSSTSSPPSSSSFPDPAHLCLISFLIHVRMQRDCTDPVSQIEVGVSRCVWDGSSCSFRPPPTTPVFTIVVALLTMLAGIPIVMLLHFMLTTFCCQQPGPVLRPLPLDVDDSPPVVRNQSPFQNQPNSDSQTRSASYNRSGSYSANDKINRTKSFTIVPFQDQNLKRTQSQVRFQISNERIDPYRADGVYSTEESSKRICRSRSELGDVIRRVATVQQRSSLSDDDLARYAFTGNDTDSTRLGCVLMNCIASYSI